MKTPVRKFREVNPANNVSPQLESIVMKALSKSNEERFQSAKELANALLHKEEIEVIADVPAKDSHGASQSAKHAAIVAAFSLLLALIFVLFLNR